MRRGRLGRAASGRRSGGGAALQGRPLAAAIGAPAARCVAGARAGSDWATIGRRPSGGAARQRRPLAVAIGGPAAGRGGQRLRSDWATIWQLLGGDRAAPAPLGKRSLRNANRIGQQKLSWKDGCPVEAIMRVLYTDKKYFFVIEMHCLMKRSLGKRFA